MKTALLLVAHGSPRAQSNADVLAVAELVRQQGTFTAVAVAYLDCNPPTIAEAIKGLVPANFGSITAVPYFLHEGRHTALDVPRQLAEMAQLYPGPEWKLGPSIGQFTAVTAVLARRAREALEIA